VASPRNEPINTSLRFLPAFFDATILRIRPITITPKATHQRIRWVNWSGIKLVNLIIIRATAHAIATTVTMKEATESPLPDVLDTDVSVIPNNRIVMVKYILN